MWDRVWINANLATMTPTSPYGEIEAGALAVSGDRIAWLGPMAALPGEPAALAREIIDLKGAWITPGLIDCHTHLVFGGDRAMEFEARLNGASYAEISAKGGGIMSTVRATRGVCDTHLAVDSAVRARALMAEGVTTLEIKSGYGLSIEGEAKQLRVARQLGRDLPVRVVTTFLGAHAVPTEFAGRGGDYIAQVATEMLPALAAEGLVDAVDAFCETIAFSVDEVATVFSAAVKLGLPVKLHADQLTQSGGAALAARFKALSADHLEYTDEAGVIALAEAGTVAVLLPAAFYVLRERAVPPIDLFRKHGVRMAVSTDCNPGTAPVSSALTMLNMACVLFGLTPAEALAGMTREAAHALGLQDEIGTLEVGKRADLAIWAIPHPASLSYWIGGVKPLDRVYGGVSGRIEA
jgi:imidazolonepropionase